MNNIPFYENSRWGGCGGALALTIITGGLAPGIFGLVALFEILTGAGQRRR